jgi:ubiquinone biosynthesis protein UbiJ
MSPIDPTLSTAAVAALEASVNHALRLDPNYLSELKAFSGAVFQLTCTQPNFNLFICPSDEGISLMANYDGPITTIIRGSSSQFAQLASSQDPARILINGDISVEGDSVPLLEFHYFLSRLDLDWEAPMVETLGDVFGHQLAELLRKLFNWHRQATRSTLRQLGDYLQEEAQLTPTRSEVQDFFRQNTRLSLRVESIEAKLIKLKQTLAKTGHSE